MRLKDKVAVITGAGSGMGKAMAELFAAEGAKLVLADISGKQNEVAAALGDIAIAVHCDVTQEAEIIAMITAAEQKFGKIDVLCNNAGFGGGMAPLHEQSTENWDRVHNANLRGVFFGLKHGVISMMKTGGGAIVNTTSASGVVGWKGHSIYGAAKAGVNQLTKSRGARLCRLQYSHQRDRAWHHLDRAEPGLKNSCSPRRLACAACPAFPSTAGALPAKSPPPRSSWRLTNPLILPGTILPVDGGFCIGYSSMGGRASRHADGITPG